MAMTIASIADGRVVPWYSDDQIPSGYVEVPPALLAKFTAGKFADGVALAKAALAGDVGEAVGSDAAVGGEAKGKKSAKNASASDALFGGTGRV